MKKLSLALAGLLLTVLACAMPWGPAPTPEFRALPAPTFTPPPTYTARPTYTPYPTPQPIPDAAEAFYRGMWVSCYMADLMLYQQQLYHLMADCEALIADAVAADQYGIDIPEWQWPPVTSTPAIFWDDSGSGEASPAQ